jgi:hypothetical protein
MAWICPRCGKRHDDIDQRCYCPGVTAGEPIGERRSTDLGALGIPDLGPLPIAGPCRHFTSIPTAKLSRLEAQHDALLSWLSPYGTDRIERDNLSIVGVLEAILEGRGPN